MKGGKNDSSSGATDRREFLKATAAGPMASVTAGDSVGHRLSNSNTKIENVAKNYFQALPDQKSDRHTAVVGCANQLCATKEAIAAETINAALENGKRVDTAVRRAQFGVRTLAEYNLTSTIDESMIVAGRQTVSRYTKYLPLLGSFNNLRAASCAVNEDEPETIKRFLFAALAFGVEVTLWSFGAPYKMAWKGTRFVSNRTFLRLAKHGCQGCIAFAMGELHWAIRGSVYAADEVVTENRVEFVMQEIGQLEEFAKELEDDSGYEVDLPTDENQIKRRLDAAKSEGPLEELVSGFTDFELPDIPDLV